MSFLTTGCNVWKYVSECSVGKWSAVWPEHFWTISIYKPFEYSPHPHPPKKFWNRQLLHLWVNFPSGSTVVLHQLSMGRGQNRPNCRPQGIMNSHSNIKVCPFLPHVYTNCAVSPLCYHACVRFRNVTSFRKVESLTSVTVEAQFVKMQKSCRPWRIV